MEFRPYPKTPRLMRDCVISEKIDGSNGQIVIAKAASFHALDDGTVSVARTHRQEDGSFLHMMVGSRNRWIAPGKATDNFGFAAWCQDNADELFKLGEGTHFGEWYGKGIGRNYGLDHRRFALFNTHRWKDNPDKPACCETVPVIAIAQLDMVPVALLRLETFGSLAVPGWAHPEGVCVYHMASKQTFKALIEDDGMSKTESEAIRVHEQSLEAPCLAEGA